MQLSLMDDHKIPSERQTGKDSMLSTRWRKIKQIVDKSSTRLEVISNESETLWIEAYDSLQSKAIKLVTNYENAISSELETALLVSRKELIKYWLNEDESMGEYDDTDNHDETHRLKAWICDMCTKTPEAVDVWVAISYIVSKVLLPPTHLNGDDCQRLVYIISRMEWYIRLPNILVEDAQHVERHRDLQSRIVTLFRSIMSYFMTTMCSHFSNPVFDAPMGTAPQTSLEIFTDLINAENAIPLLNEKHAGVLLESFIEAAMKKSNLSVQEKDRMQLPEENTRWVNELDVADPRINILKPGMDQDSSMHKLKNGLLSTQQWKSFQAGQTEEDRLLWISGSAGCGKTKLLTSIIQTMLYGNDGQVPIFFFFTHCPPDSINTTEALRTLIFLIMTNRPESSVHLKNKLSSTSRKNFNNSGDFLALSAIFYDIIRDKDLPKLFFVIGDLDLCQSFAEQSGIQEFLALITRSLSLSANIQWLVSSNNSGVVKSAFTNIIGLHLDLDSQALPDSEAALQCYIDTKIEYLAEAKKYDKELSALVKKELYAMSWVNYLWVDTACEALRTEEIWHTAEILKDLEQSNSANTPYDYAWQGFDRLPHRDGVFCRELVSTMALVYGTLHIDELKALAELEKRVDLMTMLQYCSAFLNIQQGVVSFSKQSAKSFFKDKIRQNENISQLHSKLAQRCLAYLGTILDERSDTLPGKGPSQITVLNENAKYTSLNWVTHLYQITDVVDDGELHKELYCFLEKHFIKWAEELVLQDRLSIAVVYLRRLDLYLKKKYGNVYEPKSLQAAIRDVHLFLCLHEKMDSSKDVPVHNTLLFCPTESIIKEMWLKRRLPFVSSPPTMEKYWPSNFTAFQGHNDWVRCTAFSPNGQFLASGSDDSSVRIWDTVTGTTQHKLKVERCWIYCVAISIKGIVAVGSDDGSITIWDMSTGLRLKRISQYTRTIRSLDFSGCGDKLAAATSYDVRIWDINTLRCTDLEGPQDVVASVSLSTDGKWLVAGINDGDVMLWDVANILKAQKTPKAEPDADLDTTMTGVKREDSRIITTGKNGSDTGNDATSVKTPLQIVNDHSNAVNCVTFSPNSKYIASCSDDGTARIWDVVDNGMRNSRALSISKSGAVNSVAFSPNDDGSRLAACTSHAIHIWDTETSALLQVYRSPSLPLLSLSFSPDGTYLATGLYDGNVLLWSASGRSDIEESAKENESQHVSEMALSPDRQTLAIAQGEGSVYLWNIKDNTRIETSMAFDHTSNVQSMMFSPRNGSQLLTASADRTVRICDVASGARTSLFSGHTDWVRFATWSPDEEHVVSSSDDGSIRIWKIGDEDNTSVEILYPSGSSVAWSVAYSTDQKYIASCGIGEEIVIWEQNEETRAWTETHILEDEDNEIFSIIFIPDHYQLVSSSSDTITIWNIETLEILKKISVNTLRIVNTKLRFDSLLPSYVITSYGAQPLDSDASSEHPASYPYRIVLTEDGSGWIKWHNMEGIFLPKDVSLSNVIIAGCTIIVNGDSGGVYLFKLSGTFPV